MTTYGDLRQLMMLLVDLPERDVERFDALLRELEDIENLDTTAEVKDELASLQWDLSLFEPSAKVRRRYGVYISWRAARNRIAEALARIDALGPPG
jgi:hypothetical protein